jgi:hypothetical protein
MIRAQSQLTLFDAVQSWNCYGSKVMWRQSIPNGQHLIIEPAEILGCKGIDPGEAIRVSAQVKAKAVDQRTGLKMWATPFFFFYL